MKMIDIVKELLKQGHDVEYYIRKDGGILIKRIDSQKFTSGATGNIMARSIVGAELSEARTLQLKYATATRKAYKKLKDVVVKDTIKEEWKRVKKKWNKTFKAKDGKTHPAGYFGWARIKKSIQDYGEREALRRIREAERYASGLAYSKNIKQLVNYIRVTNITLNSSAWEQLANDIEENAYLIKEEYIYPAYFELYKVDKGVPAIECARNARRVLRL